MTSGLVALLCLFLVGGVLATRIMYIFIYIEGALLTSILFIYTTSMRDISIRGVAELMFE